MEALWRGAINMFREQSTAGFKVRLLGKFARRLAAYPLAILTLLIVVSAPAAALADCNTVRGEASDLDSGFVSLYDLNFDAAHAEFAMWRAMHPEDPLGPVADASAYLFQELDRLGVLQTDLFLDDRRFGRREKLIADGHLRELFDEELSRADDLADKAAGKRRKECGWAVGDDACIWATRRLRSSCRKEKWKVAVLHKIWTPVGRKTARHRRHLL